MVLMAAAKRPRQSQFLPCSERSRSYKSRAQLFRAVLAFRRCASWLLLVTWSHAGHATRGRCPTCPSRSDQDPARTVQVNAHSGMLRVMSRWMRRLSVLYDAWLLSMVAGALAVVLVVLFLMSRLV